MATIEILKLIALVLVSGWCSAFLVQLIKREPWPSWTKLVLSAVVALAVAVAARFLSGNLLDFLKLWGNGMSADAVFIYFSGIFTAAYAWWKTMFQTEPWAKTLGAWPKKN